jgi:hypothetical protein
MEDERCDYLRWRIFARIRRFFRPTFRRPLPRRRAAMVDLSLFDSLRFCHRLEG